MKNPHVLLAEGWNNNDKTVVNGTSNKVQGEREQLLLSVSSSATGSSTKKFKRKSREPKRLYSSAVDPPGSPPGCTAKPFRGDLTADEDSAGESCSREERCGIMGVSRLATVQRRLLMPSQDLLLVPPSSSGSSSMAEEDRRQATGSPPVGGQEGQEGGGAIDMRIGTAVPAITARLQSQQQSPNVHPSHRPSSLLLLSQQQESHKLGLVSPSFPSSLSEAATSHHHHHHRHHEHPSSHQSHHPYTPHNQDRSPLFSGRPRGGASSYDDEPEPDSPQDSPRKRGGMGGGFGAELSPPGRGGGGGMVGGFGEELSPPGHGMGGGGGMVGGFGGAELSPPGRVPEIKALQQTRRLLANARERTRVHTISAAFEALRKQVPCYSYGQKLSKLAILRIACNYILSLAQLADMDYSPTEHISTDLTFSQCVEQCTRTLQAEGRSKKRKE